jgi:hypothetical protein
MTESDANDPTKLFPLLLTALDFSSLPSTRQSSSTRTTTTSIAAYKEPANPNLLFSPDHVVIRRFPASQSTSKINPQANHDHNPFTLLPNLHSIFAKTPKFSSPSSLARARERYVPLSLDLSLSSPAALRQAGLPGRQSDGNFSDCFVFFFGGKNLFKLG